MIVTLSETKLHLKIDHNDDDEEIGLMVGAAEEMIKNVTGIEFDGTNDLAKIACLYIVTEMYENRSSILQESSKKVKDIVNMILTQLSLSYGEWFLWKLETWNIK